MFHASLAVPVRDPAALARRHLAAARGVPMNANRPPPPTIGEGFSEWWQRRGKLSKIAIVIGGIWAVVCVIAIVSNAGRNHSDASVPAQAPDPYGHHCLTPWKGEHSATKLYLISNYRNAKVEWTKTTELQANGMHEITIGWSGENEWGDRLRAVAVGWLDPETCEVSMTSWQ